MAPWVKSQEGVAWQRIDIKSWNSAEARQANAEFHLEAIPYTRVYDKTGKFLGDVTGSDIEAIKRLVEKGR